MKNRILITAALAIYLLLLSGCANTRESKDFTVSSAGTQFNAARLSDITLDNWISSAVTSGGKAYIVIGNQIFDLNNDYEVSAVYTTSEDENHIFSISAVDGKLYSFETNGYKTSVIAVDSGNEIMLEEMEVGSKGVFTGEHIVVAYNDIIKVYNLGGDALFNIALRGFAVDITGAQDKEVYFLIRSGNKLTLQRIDFNRKSLVEITSLPIYILNSTLYPGGAEYDMMFRSDAKLYGLNLASDECVFIADLMKSDIDPISVSSMVELPSGKSVCFVADSDFQQSSIYELTDKEIEKTKTELTLALFNSELSGDFLAMVAEWNRANSDYRINIIQYGSGSGYYSYDGVFDSSDGYDKFALDIAAGNIPDIIDVSALPVQTLVSKGLLDDLYPYLDKDIELNREDFYPNILKALEIDGGLYQTLSGTTLTVAYTDGDVPYLTASETANLFKKSGKKYFTNAVDKWFLKEEFCAYYANDFVDWTIGQCSFDSDEFIAALELLKLMQQENYIAEENAEYFLTQEALYMMRIADETPLWHSGISITGMPARNGSSNILHGAGQQLAISSSSKHKDIAWSFVRTMLTEEYQNSFYIPCFRTHIAAQENGFAKIMSFEEDKDTIALLNQRYEIMMNVYTSTDKLYRVNSHLYDIIVEEALGYIAGDKTAAETAAVIQSRASLYVAEQR